MADDPDHPPRQRRRHRPGRLVEAFASPDSYGLVLLLLVVTDGAVGDRPLSLGGVAGPVRADLDDWLTLQASRARRRLREVIGCRD